MTKYKIDDVAKEVGLTKRTIRYYEELGLLEAPERSEGGTRLYAREHIEQLKQIVNARDVLGFSLQEIQEFVAISRKLNAHRQGYLQTEDKALKRQELLEMRQIVQNQLELMDQKLAKIAEFRKTTELRYQRLQAVLDSLAD
ncbi:MerR family transcriptional regulator [Paenibacillus sp. GCM10023248]|uniref:MerR family transcriptional regulator n=1 Tax=unclassified Paenibacillus TaxID=185978 RepID=UPI0023798D5F|nr:MerR family transcriptional regulator [Paenibacillus sp. MAHUQ-63]MDD9266567.1 MerR family transcriptional regulator [Paenibacillus sp. MAHUQ-63]